jgi:hypothetical protein
MVKIYPQQALTAGGYVLSVGNAGNASSLFSVQYNGAVNVGGQLTVSGSMSGFTFATNSGIVGGANSMISAVGVALGSSGGINQGTMECMANANSTSTSSGTGASDMDSYTLPASSFVGGNRGVKIKAWGVTASNANSKSVAILFGGTTVITKQLTVSIAGIWELEAWVLRTGASAQTYYGMGINNGGTTLSATDGPTVYTAHAQGTSAETDTSAIVIKTRATVNTTAGDIVQKGMLVEFFN